MLERCGLTPVSLLAALSILVITSVGCEPGKDLEIVNESGRPVLIDFGPERRNGIEPGLYQRRLEPGESMFLIAYVHGGAGFRLVRFDGTPTEEFSWSWEQVEAMEFRFVVR